IEVKSNQRCTSTTLNRTAVLTGGYLSGANCNFGSFRFEFTPVDNCSGANPRYDQTFTKTVTSTSPSISLNYAFNEFPTSSYPAVGYWLVRVRPRFSGYEGEYGPAYVIAVRNTATSSGMSLEPNVSPSKGVSAWGDHMEANIYPNPNNGDLVNLNITGITSNEVYVRVLDSMGREVYTNRYSVDGSLNTMVNFNQSLAQGIYMVEMRAGEEVKTLRMVVTK
ncbi:MAG TPA: T9SS type A sorting domain-containing protein, partial [Flavobacteriales bacterium]